MQDSIRMTQDNTSMKLDMLKGIGPKRRQLLERMGVSTMEDLLLHYPRRYEDRTRLLTLGELQDGQVATCLVSIASVTEQRPRAGLHLLKAGVRDESGAAVATWFNQPFLKARLTAGKLIVLTGKARRQYGRLEIMVQDMEPADEDDERGVAAGSGLIGAGEDRTVGVGEGGASSTGGEQEKGGYGKIIAVYPSSAGLQQKFFRQAIAQVLDTGYPLGEYHSDEFLDEYDLLGRQAAMEAVHRPQSWEDLERARERIIFDEFYFLQLSLALMRGKEVREQGIPHKVLGYLTDDWIRRLPFALTGAQERVIGEIREDMEKPYAMARLVQGDVGSGKTAVAAWALLLTVENGCQGAMMAPTEILAQQHYETLSAWFSPLGVSVGFFAGGAPQSEARRLRDALASGAIQVAVGTHALIQEKVVFQRLGLAVIDEQHRFGVRQRGLLQEKGDHPDTLIMSATPIPRTLAMTVYGDLDVSKLDEMPPGRKPVKTLCILEKARDKLYRFLHGQLSMGDQAFVVCPLIEESEVMDIQNAEEVYRLMCDKMKPHKVGLLHGRMSAGEKESVMSAFAEGRIPILVSTTVVEVGVNVPAATVMVIENSERFGLAQLHQLRGRVGRGEGQAYCILVTNTDEPLALQRLKLMTETNDGFLLAEEDLVLRGPGEIFGARQHGLPEFRLAKLPEDMIAMEKARQAAFALVHDDPTLEKPQHERLRRMIDRLMEDMVKG